MASRTQTAKKTQHLVWNVRFRSGYAWSHTGKGSLGTAAFVAYNGGDLKSDHLNGVALAITKKPVPPDKKGWKPWKVLQHWGEYVGGPTVMTHTLLLAHEMRSGKPYCTFITYDMKPAIIGFSDTPRILQPTAPPTALPRR